MCGIDLLGPALCRQMTSGISVDESRDFSLMLLVKPVREDVSSAEQQNNIVLLTSTLTINGRLALGIVPQVRSSYNPI